MHTCNYNFFLINFLFKKPKRFSISGPNLTHKLRWHHHFQYSVSWSLPVDEPDVKSSLILNCVFLKSASYLKLEIVQHLFFTVVVVHSYLCYLCIPVAFFLQIQSHFLYQGLVCKLSVLILQILIKKLRSMPNNTTIYHYISAL